ncbi:MAG: hypothetical protein ACRCXZ_09635, partial [Patescibacteria group bacterium]
ILYKVKMKTNKTKLLIVLFSIVAIIFWFLVGMFWLSGLFGLNTATIKCSNSNLVKVRDFENFDYIFEDKEINKSFRTDDITFYEQKIGVQSFGYIKVNNEVIKYISKNTELSQAEINNLEQCLNSKLENISNNYDFTLNSRTRRKEEFNCKQIPLEANITTKGNSEIRFLIPKVKSDQDFGYKVIIAESKLISENTPITQGNLGIKSFIHIKSSKGNYIYPSDKETIINEEIENIKDCFDNPQVEFNTIFDYNKYLEKI